MQRGYIWKTKSMMAVIALLTAGTGYLVLCRQAEKRTSAPVSESRKEAQEIRESPIERRMLVRFASCSFDPEVFGEVSYATEKLSKSLSKHAVLTDIDRTEGKCELVFINGKKQLLIEKFGTDADMYNMLIDFFELNETEDAE